MAITVTLETDLGRPCPHGFTESNSQDFATFCAELDQAVLRGGESVISRLERVLAIDLTPLRRLAEADMDVEEIAEFAQDGQDPEQLWREYMARNEAAWQPPAELIACLRALLPVLARRPDVLAAIEPLPGMPAHVASYFRDGTLQADLADVLRMAEWAEQQGAQRVRLYAE